MAGEKPSAAVFSAPAFPVAYAPVFVSFSDTLAFAQSIKAENKHGEARGAKSEAAVYAAIFLSLDVRFSHGAFSVFIFCFYREKAIVLL